MSKTSVVVDGIVLTSAQVEKAYAELHAPAPLTLTPSSGGIFNVPVSNGGVIQIQTRNGGEYSGKGLYLPLLPTGYEWALEYEAVFATYPSARTLRIRQIGNK